MEAMAIYIILMTVAIVVLTATGYKSRGMLDYNQGWRDHEELMRLYEMTPDDEALLRELKQAMKLYIKQTGLYRSGDVKRLERAEDFKEFRDEAWRMTVLRKEQK